MTRRTPALLAILVVSLIALFSSNASSAEVRELTNADVVSYEQPCYNKATTRVLVHGDVTTWCDIQIDGGLGVITCTSAAEPAYCGDAK